MTVKTILAMPTGPATDAATLECALQLAGSAGAHIDVVHVSEPPVPSSLTGFDMAAGYLSDTLLTELEEQRRSRDAALREAFDAFVRARNLDVSGAPASGGQVSAALRTADGRAGDWVARHGGAYDVIVLGQPQDGVTGPAGVAMQSALAETGRPVLMAPVAAPVHLGETVMIGWNRSAPAARAVHAAKTLLLDRARRVRLLSVATGAKQGPPAEEIAANLARHGIEAEIREFQPDFRSIGDVLLAEASAFGADLLVMGAYSHGRLRRLMLGGVTQHVVANATLAVFMAH